MKTGRKPKLRPYENAMANRKFSLIFFFRRRKCFIFQTVGKHIRSIASGLLFFKIEVINLKSLVFRDGKRVNDYGSFNHEMNL